MTRKFSEDYQKFLENAQNENKEGLSYLDWLESERLNYLILREEIVLINNMITLLYPEIIPPEGGKLSEIIGILISKASRNSGNYAE